MTFNGKEIEFKFEKKNGIFGGIQANVTNGNKEVFIGKNWRFWWEL